VYAPGTTMPNPSTTCRRSRPEMALQMFQGWPARRAGALWLSSTFLDTPHQTPLVSTVIFVVVVVAERDIPGLYMSIWHH
jgi:hypothetical protein